MAEEAAARSSRKASTGSPCTRRWSSDRTIRARDERSAAGARAGGHVPAGLPDRPGRRPRRGGSTIVAALGAPRGSHYLVTQGVHRYRDLAARIDGLTGRHCAGSSCRHGPCASSPGQRPRRGPTDRSPCPARLARLPPRQRPGRRHVTHDGRARDRLPADRRDAERHDPVVGGPQDHRAERAGRLAQGAPPS